MTYRNIIVETKDRVLANYAGPGPYCFNQHVPVTGYYRDYINSTNSPRDSRGFLIFRENELERIFIKQLPAFITYTVKNVDCGKFSCAFPGPSEFLILGSTISSHVLRQQELAQQAFYDGISDIKVNLAEAFATRKETVRMVATTAMKLASYYRSFRRGYNPFSKKSCNSRNASNYWLEYSYGWSPLLGDLYEVLQLDKLEPPPVDFNVTRRIMIPVNFISPEHNPIEGVNASIHSNYDGYASVKVKIVSKVVVTDPEGAFSHALGLDNPALLTWELLPYSFVVDWFLPIGNYLEATTALRGLNVISCSTTIGVKSKVMITPHVVQDENLVFASGHAFHDELTISRRVGIPPIPSPRFKDPVSITHALNGIALLRSAFGR